MREDEWNNCFKVRPLSCPFCSKSAKIRPQICQAPLLFIWFWLMRPINRPIGNSDCVPPNSLADNTQCTASQCNLKLNSWTYNFVEVSGHNLESYQTWGFHIKCLPYKPIENHFCSGGRGGGLYLLVDVVNNKEENSEDLIFVSITSKNLASHTLLVPLQLQKD